MQGSPLILDAKLLQSQMQAVAAQAADIHQLIHEEQVSRLRHWEQEEKGELEQMVSSLLVSQDILKKERKSIKAAYHTTFAIAAQQQAAYVKAAAEQFKKAQPSADVVDLQTKLVELNNRLLEIDLDIKVVNRDLALATKRDEQELHSTRLIVMQVGVCAGVVCFSSPAASARPPFMLPTIKGQAQQPKTVKLCNHAHVPICSRVRS